MTEPEPDIVSKSIDDVHKRFGKNSLNKSMMRSMTKKELKTFVRSQDKKFEKSLANMVKKAEQNVKDSDGEDEEEEPTKLDGYDFRELCRTDNSE